MGRSQRRKGADAERELLKKLGDELGIVLQRNITQTRGGGADCLELRGFAIEVKRQERQSVPSWWRQACDQAERVGAEPMLATRQSHKPWRFYLKAETGYREATLIEAAGHIREKFARLYAIYPDELNGATYSYG